MSGNQLLFLIHLAHIARASHFRIIRGWPEGYLVQVDLCTVVEDVFDRSLVFARVDLAINTLDFVIWEVERTYLIPAAGGDAVNIVDYLHTSTGIDAIDSQVRACLLHTHCVSTASLVTFLATTGTVVVHTATEGVFLGIETFLKSTWISTDRGVFEVSSCISDNGGREKKRKQDPRLDRHHEVDEQQTKAAGIL